MSGNLLMTGCCCDASPCDDCSDPSSATVVVSGGYNATLTYNAKYTSECECYWTWSHVVDSVTVITLTVAWTGSGWCAQAYSTTLGRWTSDDCSCGTRLGAITGLVCDSVSGKITGSFSLPKVGGGAGLSVSMT
ncbi:MAG: hypothetical protein HN350_16630 [Phycisphaerales bacterium]|jgi:hypothetical protein|nr:hypothetical protein [Phycisphaerales bacterium]